MELYKLDSLLRRTAVIDRFESLIWTERYNKFGDFKLKIHSDRDARDMFTPDSILAMNESKRLMMVENVENKRNADGTRSLHVTGRSLELILGARVIANKLNLVAEENVWEITDKPADIARTMFDEICIQGRLDVKDILPNVGTSSIFPPDTIGEPTDVITQSVRPQQLVDAIEEVCSVWDLGYRLVQDPFTNLLYFNIYAGSDRTSLQSTLDPVLFSEGLDNLSDTTELTSVEDRKTTAYVMSENGDIKVDGDAQEDVSGFDRRVLYSDGSSIKSGGSFNDEMQQKGIADLTQHRSFTAFDGVINRNSQYVYGVDYHLGDLVDIMNSDGRINRMRVTEQIFASDIEGERSYPTLTINTSITPGSWIAWDINQVWEDFTTEFWDELP